MGLRNQLTKMRINITQIKSRSNKKTKELVKRFGREREASKDLGRRLDIELGNEREGTDDRSESVDDVDEQAGRRYILKLRAGREQTNDVVSEVRRSRRDPSALCFSNLTHEFRHETRPQEAVEFLGKVICT